MNKLTKEQADWLINNLSQYCFMAPKNRDVEMSVTRDNILKLLNQCTEKQFPEVNVKANEGFVQVSEGDAMNGIYITIWSEVLDDKAFVSLSVDNFKRLTEGCNKILEWIDAEVD